jgi:hypothetical protein
MVNRLSLKESTEVDGTLISEVKEAGGVTIKRYLKATSPTTIKAAGLYIN